MQTFDLDISQPEKGSTKRGMGCSFGGWAVFLIVLGVMGFLGYRTVFYYQKLRAGDIVELPQFDGRLSIISGSGGIGPTSVDRSTVESPSAPAFGPASEDAKLVITEFGDFQCPYSKEEAMVLRRLMNKYADRVRFEFRDYPLTDIHPDAAQAALAGRCAHEQGKFWVYHDKLFLNSPALSYQQLITYAAEVGMDGIQFERCLLDQRYQGAVNADAEIAKGLGIRGTPTFFLNGRRIDGAVPEDVLEGLIKKMIE